MRCDQRVGIGAGLKQLFNQRSSTDAYGFGQRRGAVTIERGYVRTRRQKRIYGFQVAPVRRPVQRRGAISFRGIHVHVLFQKRAGGFCVLILHGVHQRGTAVRAGERGHRQQRRERAFD